MQKKLRKKQERVVTEVASPTPCDWGRICGLPWRGAGRILIGALFAGDGTANADSACEGAWSRVMQVNRTFVKYKLPFRIRKYNLPKDMLPTVATGYSISTFGLQIHVVEGVL